MKKILLIDDQPEKRESIKNFILGKFVDVLFTEKESLRGGLKEIIMNPNYDLILLDMSMPNFDQSDDSFTDLSPESFAGKEILEQMNFRGIYLPVIVITQYSTFEGGTVTLDTLNSDFKIKFDKFYIGAVYFNSALDAWKENIISLIEANNG